MWRNPEMLNRSRNLNGYSIFIGKINEYKKYLPLEDSVRNTVKYCIEHNVLKEFLEEYGSEVINMLFEDFTTEEIATIRYKEGRKEGREEGREEAREEEKILIARNLLAEGSTPEFIQKITGLDMKVIQELQI